MEVSIHLDKSRHVYEQQLPNKTVEKSGKVPLPDATQYVLLVTFRLQSLSLVLRIHCGSGSQIVQFSDETVVVVAPTAS